MHKTQRSNTEQESATTCKDMRPDLPGSVNKTAVAVQCKFSANSVVQREASTGAAATLQGANQTGMPNRLKSGLENLSGYDLSAVRVHYNSPKPEQLGALAYAQGTNIHLGAGQEKHLPHEAWHVVQQMQGRVKPTLQMKSGVNVNDDICLEKEADVMGAKVLSNVIQVPTAVASPRRVSTPTSQFAAVEKVKDIIGSKGDQGRAKSSISAGVLQAKLALTDNIVADRLRGIRVSDGGAQGVVIIPSVVAKVEEDTQSAIDMANINNAFLAGIPEGGWTAGTPAARLASPAEADYIAQMLTQKDQAKPGSVGDSTRVANMIAMFNNNRENIVIYEQATGKDFVNHLATGPLKADTGIKQSKGGNPKKGSGLAQLADTGYARQLGRIVAVDIFMGNKDRLHHRGNFENWMSDSKNKTISLVDNAMSADAVAAWAAHSDAADLIAGNYDDIATRVTGEVQGLLFNQHYGGGKLADKDTLVWISKIKQKFKVAITDGIVSGIMFIWQKGPALKKELADADSPLSARFTERLARL